MALFGILLVLFVVWVLIILTKVMFKTGFFGENIPDPPKKRKW